MPIAEVLRADEGLADVGVVDRDRVFSYEIKIYDTSGDKVAELASHIGKVTVNNITFGYLRNGGCADFSFTLSEEYTKATIGYNYRVEICLYSQPNPWFTGFITKLPEKGTDKIQYYSGFGYVKQLSWIRVNEVDTAEEVAGIIEDTVDNYLVPNTDIQKNSDKLDTPIYDMVSTIYWERVTALDMFQRLQQLAGDYEFGVDEDRDFYFREIDILIREKFWIGKHLTEFKASEDQEAIRNKLYVKCGRLTDGSDYVFYVENVASQTAYGLREEVVTAPEFWPTDSADLASGIGPPALSTNLAAGVPNDNATDGDVTTYWDSGEAQEEDDYIQIDLGAVYDRISRVVLDSTDDAASDQFARGFNIRVATTLALLVEDAAIVFTSQALSTNNPDIRFTPVQGRYIRITLTVGNTEEWHLCEFKVYELDTSDIERWAGYLLAEKKDIRKKATLTIRGVDKLISKKATIVPYKPSGQWGIYDEDGNHINDYYPLAVKYNLSPSSFDMSAELGQLESETIPAFFKKTLQRLEEYNMSGIRKIDDLSGATGAKPLGITRTIIGPEVIEVPHLKGNKISLHGGLIEMGKGVMSAGGHGFVVKDGGGIFRFEAGKLNGDYGATVRDVFGNTTVNLGILAGEADKRNLDVKVNATRPSHQVDVDADLLKLDSIAKVLTSVNLTIDITASGVNGLDTGIEAISTWYSIWVIWNPSTDTVAGLFSTSATDPTMPGGYTRKRRVGWVRNDSIGDFASFFRVGDWLLKKKVLTILDTDTPAVVWTEIDCRKAIAPTSYLFALEILLHDQPEDSETIMIRLRRKGLGDDFYIGIRASAIGGPSSRDLVEMHCDTDQRIEYMSITDTAQVILKIRSFYDPI